MRDSSNKNGGFLLEFEEIVLPLQPIPKGMHKMLGKYQSGQMGQTVNLLAYAFGGSNPSLPTMKSVAEVAQSIEH